MDVPSATVDSLLEDFSFLDDWEDRYRYVIELGRTLSPLSETERSEANKVRGCASQVWMVSEAEHGAEPVLHFRGDSDAHIVRGLIALLLALYSGRPAREIVSANPEEALGRFGLREHLTSQRSNGFSSMVARMRSDAQAALARA